MTTATDTDTATVLQGAGLLLVDFDGPICSVFAGRPARDVANTLRAFAHEQHVSLPPEVEQSTDPLDVIRHVGLSREGAVVRCCDEFLTSLEIDAVATATPTPGGHDLITAAHVRGIPVVIVSNNSAQAICSYLTAHHLTHAVTRVEGRPPGRPALMKPHPWLLNQATLDRPAMSQVFIGDSVTDLLAGQAAGVTVIALANKPGKAERFHALGAQHVVTDMRRLATWLTSAPAQV